MTVPEYWAVNLTGKPLPDLIRRVQASPLVPSLVTQETRGYRVGFRARDGHARYWHKIARLCVGRWFCGNATDMLPITGRVVHKADVNYTSAQMVQAFGRGQVEITPHDVRDEARTWAEIHGASRAIMAEWETAVEQDMRESEERSYAMDPTLRGRELAIVADLEGSTDV